MHTHEQVVRVARCSVPSERIGDPARADELFRMLVRNSGGHESRSIHVRCSTRRHAFGTPAWAGNGGIPGRGGSTSPQMSYRPDDVLGLRRERHAGKRTLVVGGGASAATTVVALAKLAAEVRTSVVGDARGGRGVAKAAGERSGARPRRTVRGRAPAARRWRPGCHVVPAAPRSRVSSTTPARTSTA